MASSSRVELSEIDKKIAALQAAIEDSTSDSDESDSSDSEASEANQHTLKNENKKCVYPNAGPLPIIFPIVLPPNFIFHSRQSSLIVIAHSISIFV